MNMGHRSSVVGPSSYMLSSYEMWQVVLGSYGEGLNLYLR
jgi:hypothetical protein